MQGSGGRVGCGIQGGKLSGKWGRQKKKKRTKKVYSGGGLRGGPNIMKTPKVKIWRLPIQKAKETKEQREKKVQKMGVGAGKPKKRTGIPTS